MPRSGVGVRGGGASGKPLVKHGRLTIRALFPAAKIKTTMAPVTVKEKDYLEQDPPVRGQNYACMSFLSPEEAISSRAGFAMEKFADNFGKELSGILETMSEHAKALGNEDVDRSLVAFRERFGYMMSGREMKKEFDLFMATNEIAISKEYSDASDGVACVRGIKIRGCYETLDEAKHRCEALKRTDPKFSVYVAEVGCWCPWSPNPEELAAAAGDQNVAQYSETALNTLMMRYQENVDERDQFYIDRKQALVADGKNKAKAAKVAEGLCTDTASESASDHEERRRIMAELEADDAWTKAKLSR